MKKLLITLSITLISNILFSQNIGIGTTNPQATLDVTSTTNGFLPPRMTFAQRAAIVNPAQGLIVYCTDCVANGELSVFNGVEWKSANISNNPVVGTIPLAPTNLTAGLEFGPLYTSLNWEDVSTTESGYKIERKTGSGVFSNLAQLGINVTAYNDSSVAQNTVYSYRVYAYNAAGNSDQYSNIVSIATPGLSIINTTTVSSISLTSAISGGTIISDGGSAITARGVCWSTIANPTVDLNTKTVNGNGSGTFTSSITGLTPNTTYHVRSYATNILGTAYGADSVFTTLSIEPRMTIAAVRSMYTGSGLKVNTPASIAGIVTSDATQKNIATGTIIIQDQTAAIAVYFGGTMPYNVGDSIAFNITNDSLTNYRGSLQIKTPNGTSLPNVLSSGRSVIPIVKTISELNSSLTNPLGSSSNMELTLVTIMGATASGVATYSGNKTLTDGTGSITMYTASSALFASTPMPSGPSNFTGYVKMYTTTKEFLIRNPNDVQPLTLAVMLPTVSEISINDISSDSAIILGNVESDGNDVLTAKGVCWSIYPDPTNDLTTKTDEGAVSGSFTSYITGLTPNTTYHVRAYATNIVGTAYSADSVFTTLPILFPIVSTTAITSININNATSGGEVTFDGNLPITERGVVWSASANPTIALSTKTVDGSGTGIFISSITGLISNTTYHVRAYATNTVGTAYGNEIVFTMSDISFITVGSKVWSSSNLSVAKYRNGESIPEVVDPNEWPNLTTGAWCWYNNDSATYASTYGRLYNWYAVNDPRGLAPQGWHVPSDVEWNILVKCIDPSADTACIGCNQSSIAGGAMKSTTGWSNPNTGATNSIGFAALPSGIRGEYDGLFYNVGYDCYWWSSTDYLPIVPYVLVRNLDFSSSGFGNAYGEKSSGFSVRLVRD